MTYNSSLSLNIAYTTIL